ncbi:MAG: hypothetical protein IIA62_05565 [Nitrospinae bacterium]|nr:hypothetical protein [Nitrospinota bacterium]
MDKAKLTGIGALLAAGIGSVCCVGPAILAGLGFGAGALSFVRSFGILHMPMVVLAFILLGSAFYLHFRKSNKVNSGPGCSEVEPGQTKRTRTILWTATGLTLFLFLLPYFI